MRLFVLVAMVSVMSACAQTDEVAVETAGDMLMPQTNNHIDYIELAAPDLGAAKAFYNAAFGWEFQDWGPDYASFTGAGRDGGIRGGEAPVTGSTLVILYADDLEASEKRVVDAGGEVTERHEFPGGRRFHFRDPSGNILAVWTQVPME